ncbi:STAS domain-containing protein [Streptomyces sp. NPDC050504]|uniref:STAS domain-containing protein n=1 Tax=Streptomyces sp. NPDC050504 TaxID=3365618 RepID=UPI0037AA4170
MSQRQTHFRARQRKCGTSVVVELRGELDILTAQPLASCLRILTSGEGRDVIVDLRGVTFVDCSGLRPLCVAHTRLAAQGRRLRIVVTRPFVVKVLALCGLDETFELLETVPTGERSHS